MKTREKELDKKIKKFQDNVESQIFFTDDPEELKLLGAVFLQAAKAIFLATEGVIRTKAALIKYVNDIKEEKTS